jgi:hypothetical protein
MSQESPDVPPISSRAEFAAAVQWFVDRAAQRSARTMCWLDPDFNDWPLDNPQLLGSLGTWLKLPQRRLLMVAADWSRVAREHPRFCAWRLPRAHVVDTRRAPEEMAAETPCVLLDDGPTSVHLLDRTYWRGVCSADPHDAYRLRERFDALTQRSEPDFAPTTLGL